MLVVAEREGVEISKLEEWKEMIKDEDDYALELEWCRTFRRGRGEGESA